MRRHDKLKNIERINILAEQRYLKSKGLLKESCACDEGAINESQGNVEWEDTGEILTGGGKLVVAEHGGKFYAGTIHPGDVDVDMDGVEEISQEEYLQYDAGRLTYDGTEGVVNETPWNGEEDSQGGNEQFVQNAKYDMKETLRGVGLKLIGMRVYDVSERDETNEYKYMLTAQGDSSIENITSVLNDNDYAGPGQWATTMRVLDIKELPENGHYWVNGYVKNTLDV